MSYRVEFKTEVNDLDLFKKVCQWNGVNFDITTMELREGNTFLGRLQNKKDNDGGSGSCVLVTDSDYVGDRRLRSNNININNIMRDYGEQISYKVINNVGSLMSRTVDGRRIILKVAVNG